MGHVINPVSQRVGETRFWDSTWAISNASLASSYSYLNAESILIVKYCKRVMQGLTRKLFGRGLVFLTLRLLRASPGLTLLVEFSMKHLLSIYNLINVSFKNTVLLIKTLNRSIPSARPKLLDATNFTSRLTQLGSPAVKPRFIRRTSRMTRFIGSHAQPDPLAYTWYYLLSLINLSSKKFVPAPGSTNQSLLNKLTIIDSFSKSLFNSWSLSLTHLMAPILRPFFNAQTPIKIIFSAISSNAITASFIARYLSTRLLQKFPLKRVINLIIKQLQYAQSTGAIQGFKIACNGRFERRGRATHTWKVFGRLPKSDVKIDVDYSIMLPVLANSICAVKVWIVKNNTSVRSVL